MTGMISSFTETKESSGQGFQVTTEGVNLITLNFLASLEKQYVM